jgi:hypothetical protein
MMTLGCSRCGAPSGVHSAKCKGLVRPGDHTQLIICSSFFSWLVLQIALWPVLVLMANS